MTDSIILKYLSREYTNDNPSIYLYVKGGIKNKAMTLGKVFNDISPLFSPSYSDDVIRKTIRDFFERERLKYKNGEFAPTPIYSEFGFSISK